MAIAAHRCARLRARRVRLGSAVALAAVAAGGGAAVAVAQDMPFSAPAAGRIVYTRQASDTFDIYTSDPDGTNERRLSDIDDSAAGEDQPRWSPDGRHVAFASYPSSLLAIDIIAAEGGPVRTVVERDGTSGNPAWSPDGRCLVYDGGQGTSQDDVKRLDLKVWCDDGSPKGTLRRLTNTPDLDEREADWAPDGATIVFAARSNRPNTTDRWKLWRIRPDGTGREPVIDLPDSHERQPRFSPDGRHLAFVTGRQPFSFGTLAVLDLASGAVERFGEGASDALSWSPDGGEILFANIFRGGIRPVPAGAAAAAARLDLAGAVAQGAAQHAGLYRVEVRSRRITRLRGAAGGAEAPNDPNNFEFGYMPDWTAGTATPTPDATPTPTPTTTATASATATATDEPTPTPVPPRIYLPVLRRDPPPEPTAAPSPTFDPAVPTPEASAPAPTIAPWPSDAPPTAAATPGG